MVEPFKLAKFLDELCITAEEYWLLYRVMINQNNYDDNLFKVPRDINIIEFGQLSQKYQDRHDINWIQICKNLEQKEYLEIWGNDENIKLTNLKVTDKFLQYFYITDVEDAFEQFIAIYPKQVHIKDINGLTKPKKYSVWGKHSKDELVEMFRVNILKGNNNILFTRFMEITKLYLDDCNSNSAPYNIEGYFKAFDGIAAMYEDQHKTELKIFNDDI